MTQIDNYLLHQCLWAVSASVSVGAWVEDGKFEWGGQVRKDSSIHPQPFKAISEDAGKNLSCTYINNFSIYIYIHTLYEHICPWHTKLTM